MKITEQAQRYRGTTAFISMVLILTAVDIYTTYILQLTGIFTLLIIF